MERITLILKARGQLIYNESDPTFSPIKMVQLDNVRYASCANFGVCAYPQPDDISDAVATHSMDEILPHLGAMYKDYYQPVIDDPREYEEFRFQKDNFWTEKGLRYDKYLRFYPRENHGDKSAWGLVAYRNQRPLSLEHLISRTERIQLSTLLQNIKAEFPDATIEVYDPGCLKLLSDKEVMINGVSEPDQQSRIPPSTLGGRRKKRKTKRKNK